MDTNAMLRHRWSTDPRGDWTKKAVAAGASDGYNVGARAIVVIHASVDIYVASGATEAAAEAASTDTAGRLLECAGGWKLHVLEMPPGQTWLSFSTRGTVAGEVRYKVVGTAAT